MVLFLMELMSGCLIILSFIIIISYSFINYCFIVIVIIIIEFFYVINVTYLYYFVSY